MPMINETGETLFEGVGGVEEIDQVIELGMAHPMGPAPTPISWAGCVPVHSSCHA